MSRLDYGKKYCHNSPTMDETPLQEAIMAAVNTRMPQKMDVVTQITDALLQEAMPSRDSAMSLGEVKRRIEELTAEFDQLLELDACGNETDRRFAEIAKEMAELKRQQERIAAQLRNNREAQERVHNTKTALDQEDHYLAQWDEEMIRQLVHTVKVISADHIRVYLNDGTEIDQEVYAWIEYWLQVRQCACELLKTCCLCIHRILEEKTANSAASSFDLLHMRFNKMLIAPLSYPREHRPFEKKITFPEQFRKAKGSYFDGIQNYSNQFIQFVKREKNNDNLALYNLRTALAALPNMQRFFEHLELNKKLRIMHDELCEIEEHTLMDAYMCCVYYLSHTPDPRFKKYDIKAYFESSKKAEIADVNSSLGELATLGAVFPRKVYRENIFTCYPILLRDYDITDETLMQAFLLKSIAFADATYDYLVMLIADGEGKIIPNALKFPKRAFQCIQAELYGKDFEYIEDFTSPFPVEVTSDMLECFEGEFMLQEQSPNKEWLGRISDIGEELWVYSKTREILIDESDRQYLNESLATVKTKIEKMLGLLGTSADSKTESLIRDLCSEVYSGEVFDDEKYNELIDCIQAMSTIKDQ